MFTTEIAFSSSVRDTISNDVQTTNTAFNSIYRQTAPAGFFGNEYGNPIKTSLVADVNPNVAIFQTSKSRFFALFSPRVKLRLLDARKAPVRSPSYMPGLKVFGRLNNDPERPRFLALAYSHHSNGQDGPTLDSLGRFNRGKGKFTTNYYTLDYIFGKSTQGANRSENQFASLGIEIHTGLFNVGYSKELAGNYGFIRVNGSWIYDIHKVQRANKHRDHYRIHASFSYILDTYQNYSITNAGKRSNTSVSFIYQPGFMDNVGLTIGTGYRGQDDYNIYFEDSYAYMSIGVAYGFAFKQKEPPKRGLIHSPQN